MMKTWNLVLVVITFFLTIFGTFMTRSGAVQSVHAFGEDNVLALQFIVFMALILVVSIGLIVYRSNKLAVEDRVRLVLLARVRVPAQQLDPPRVRVLRAVRDDVPDDLRGARRLARLGRPRVLQQVDDAARRSSLLFLAGAAPLLAWRKTTRERLWNQFLFPTGARRRSTIVGCSRSALPQTHAPVASIFADADRAADLARQLRARSRSSSARSARSSGAACVVRRRQTGSDPFTSLIGLVLVEAPQVRRLHRPPRRRGPVLRLRRQGVGPMDRPHDRAAARRRWQGKRQPEHQGVVRRAATTRSATRT